MYSSRVHSSSLIFILWFCLCLVGQASSRKCYVCESSIHETCYTNVNNGSFQSDCAEILGKPPKSIDESSEYLQTLINKYSKEYRAANILDFDCVTFIGKNVDEARVVRMCVPKTEDCNAVELHLLSAAFLRHHCNTCHGNLCNSYPQEKPPDREKKYKEAKSYAKTMKSDVSKHRFSYATILLVPIFLRLY